MSTQPPSSSFEDEPTPEREYQQEPDEASAVEIEQEQAEQEAVSYPASTLPQEAQGEAHGGPLGCCLGTVAGLLLTLLLIMGVSLLLTNGGYLGVATLPVALLGGVLGGVLGWQVGKRLYREYEQPVVVDRRRRKVRSGTTRMLP